MENYNTHMKLSWGLVHLGYNTPEKYGCFNTATYGDVDPTYNNTTARNPDEMRNFLT